MLYNCNYTSLPPDGALPFSNIITYNSYTKDA